MDAIAQALADSAWSGELAVSLRTRLRTVARSCRVANGAAIYRQGDPPDGLYCVLSGTVRLVSYAVQGTAHVLLLARRGDWFGEISTLDARPRQQDAVGEERADLLHVSMRDVETIGATDPRLWRAIGRLASLHQRAALSYFQSIVPLPVEGRVVALLRILDDRSPGSPLRITHEEIASSIGHSRQRVTTVLRQLADQGVLALGYRSVTLTTRARSAHAAIFR